MSDEAIGAEAPQPDPTPDLGTIETEQAVADQQPAIPSTFTVKVGGEELQVSLEEALNGYMRQEDYTRKTQGVAAEREQLSHADQLWNAIERDPQTTIKQIADAYGMQLTPQQEAAAARSDDPFGLEDDADQADPVVTEMKQFMEQARMERVQAEITRELTDVHSKYGVNFDDDLLLQYALDHSIGNLEDAFRSFAFEGMTRAATDKQVQQRKANAPPVAGGHGVAAGVVSPGTGAQFPTIAEAFAAAEAAHIG